MIIFPLIYDRLFKLKIHFLDSEEIDLLSKGIRAFHCFNNNY